MSFGFLQQFNNYIAPASGFPTISQTAFSSDSGADCGAPITISFSSTPTNGSLIILAVTDNLDSASGGFTGFTQLTGGTASCRVFYKIASSETNLYSYTYFGTGASDGGILTGLNITANFSTPIDLSSATPNSGTSPSITTTKANELILSIGGDQASLGGFVTQPSGFTLSRTDNVGLTYRLGVAYKQQAIAGATGTNAWNVSTYTTANVFTIGVRSV